MKKTIITLIVMMVSMVLAGCTARDSRVADATATASVTETNSVASVTTRVYGTPYHVCPEKDDYRTYKPDSTPISSIDGVINLIGADMVSVSLELDETDLVVLKNMAGDGYVNVTLMTTDKLVATSGKATPALSGAYDEVVKQLRLHDVDGTVCVTLYEVDAETLEYIRVNRGW